MIYPPRPVDEAERLAALYRLNILDTPAEERFDRITRLASRLYELPVSYVSLMDAERQWIKASCGLPFSESSRDESFCGHAILEPEPLIVPDAQHDPRFADNPMVTSHPHIRFYAGCPLRSPEGQPVGTLCVADRRPRRFTPADLSQLKELAALVEDQLNLMDVVDLQDELLVARDKLQQALAELRVRNEVISKLFGTYMTDEVAAELLARPESITLGGERKKVTVLLSDLRGFTELSERLAPEQVVDALNRYLARMVDIILKHGGTIDAFIGDAILVVFGAPRSHGDDAARAIACALDMQLAMGPLNEEAEDADLPALAMGIGINAGEVVVGNIGSVRRMKYSVIGSAVNRAARIQSLTMGGQVLVAAEVLEEVAAAVRVDGALRVQVKGVDRPVPICEVGAIGKPYNIHLPRPEEVIGLASRLAVPSC